MAGPEVGGGVLDESGIGGGLLGEPEFGGGVLDESGIGGGLLGEPEFGGGVLDESGTAGGLLGEPEIGGGVLDESGTGGGLLGEPEIGGGLLSVGLELEPEGSPPHAARNEAVASGAIRRRAIAFMPTAALATAWRRVKLPPLGTLQFMAVRLNLERQIS